jgi:hypothetical protein
MMHRLLLTINTDTLLNVHQGVVGTIKLLPKILYIGF